MCFRKLNRIGNMTLPNWIYIFPSSRLISNLIIIIISYAAAAAAAHIIRQQRQPVDDLVRAGLVGAFCICTSLV